MKLINYLKNIRNRLNPHQPIVEVLISKNRLLHNLNQYRQLAPGVKLAPVLKSNAYGHGLIQIAKILDEEDLAFFVLDSLYEAIDLRRNGIKSRILILGYVPPKDICKNKLKDMAFAITSFAQLEEINKLLRSPQIFHLKIDTGMHRQGVLPAEIQQTIKIIKENKNIRLEGLCSHFADADGVNTDFTNKQIETWNKLYSSIKSELPNIPYFHLAATKGIGFSNRIKANVARLGIGLYGINTSLNSKLDIKPILEMRTIISSVRDIEAGEYVGYNLTYRATNKRKIATIPVGYFEGVDRRISNKSSFKIKNKQCPITGRVGMNITSCDVTDLPEIKIGEPVIIISSDNNDPNSAVNIAKICDTIPYEILVHIPQHLRRTVI